MNAQQPEDVHNKKINRMCCSRPLFRQCCVLLQFNLVAIGCGLVMGFSSIFLAQYHSHTELRLDAEAASWFVSLLNFAQPFGSMCSGVISDHCGRKMTLLLSTIPMGVGWICIALATHASILYTGRVLNGFGVGLVTTAIQVIIAEVMEPQYRDFMLGIPYVSYNLGIALQVQLGEYFRWRTIAWGSCGFSFLSGFIILFAHESPVYLVQKGHLVKALRTLIWLRDSDVKGRKEYADLFARHEAAILRDSLNQGSIWNQICVQSVLKAVLLTYVFRVWVVLSGALIVVFYIHDILGALCTKCIVFGVYISYVRFLFVIICCMLLQLIGRRPFVIFTTLMATVFLMALVGYRTYRWTHDGAISDTIDLYVTTILIGAYVALSGSFLLMTGVMMGELMPARNRGRIGGFNSAMFNFANFGFGLKFPTLLSTIHGTGILLVFGFSSMFLWLTVMFMMPETKNRSLGEIEDYFRDDKLCWYRSKEAARLKELKKQRKQQKLNDARLRND